VTDSPSPAASNKQPFLGSDPLETLEGRWTLRILLCLHRREHRFSDLKAAIPGISANLLAERLRLLESAGIVERHYLPPPFASHVYLLATLAADLKPALGALVRWRADYARSAQQDLRGKSA
jgi:DNA-binding HxlR family transcriptional regulator